MVIKMTLKGVSLLTLYIVLFFAYYIAFFTLRFAITENLTLRPIIYTVNENCIVVTLQRTSGSNTRVIKGRSHILDVIETSHPNDWTVADIEITGKSVESLANEVLNHPDYLVIDWLIYGRVVGATDRYDEWFGIGFIPVFEAERIYPITSISRFLVMDTIWDYKPHLTFLVLPMLFFGPIIGTIVILVILTRREPQQN